MRKFEFVSNGEENGWLIVSSVDLARVGKNRSHFSNASLMSPRGEIALDHAGDALVFLRVWNAKFGSHESIASHYTAVEVETWSPFGSKGIDAPSFVKQSEFNQEQSAAEVGAEEMAHAAYEQQMRDRAYHNQELPEEFYETAHWGSSLP